MPYGYGMWNLSLPLWICVGLVAVQHPHPITYPVAGYCGSSDQRLRPDASHACHLAGEVICMPGKPPKLQDGYSVVLRLHLRVIDPSAVSSPPISAICVMHRCYMVCRVQQFSDKFGSILNRLFFIRPPLWSVVYFRIAPSFL